MKTISFKSLLILSGIILTSVIALGFNNNIKEALMSELSNFDIHSLYAVAGILALSALIYSFAYCFGKSQKKQPNKHVDYTYNRSLHHRPVIKKTA